ncbi:MAG: EAL domain-containing protein [Pseudomonadota bacterium]
MQLPRWFRLPERFRAFGVGFGRLSPLYLLWIPLAALLVASVLVGLLKTHHGVSLLQVNARQLDAALELEAILRAPSEAALPASELRERLIELRRAPVECVRSVDASSRFILRLAGSKALTAHCQDNALRVEQALATLDALSAERLTEAQARAALVDTTGELVPTAMAFDAMMTRTLSLLTRTTSLVLLLGAGIVGACLALLSTSITRSMRDMEETAQALARSEQLSKQLAHIDSVTALPNRTLYTERLDAVIKQATSSEGVGFAVMFFDLDGFKNVNDDLGHAAGDIVLMTTAMRLAARVRGEDTVARFGGDEFAAVLTGLDDPERIDAVCQDMIERVAESITIDGHQVGVTTSIGVAVYPEHGTDASTLMKNADIAMYDAKGAGKNRVRVFDSTLQDRLTDRVRIQRDLRQAIEQEQLQVYFQPVVKLRTQRIESAEALLRWTHPERGPISPVEFIPIAEETGMILELGEWVLRQACLQCLEWQRRARNDKLRIAVNVSPRQLAEPDFSQRVARVLEETGMAASELDLEMTETTFIGEDEACITNLNALAELGVRLLLDDFGTGYSSFSYLYALPFKVLKIDRSLIRNIEEEARPLAIIASILSMSRALGMSVIAEGVETEGALNTLRGLGCQAAQGYLFQAPVSAEAFDPQAKFERDADGGAEPDAGITATAAG